MLAFFCADGSWMPFRMSSRATDDDLGERGVSRVCFLDLFSCSYTSNLGLQFLNDAFDLSLAQIVRMFLSVVENSYSTRPEMCFFSLSSPQFCSAELGFYCFQERSPETNSQLSLQRPSRKVSRWRTRAIRLVLRCPGNFGFTNSFPILTLRYRNLR